MKCCICKEEIKPGEHVYPGVLDVWHTDCKDGECYAVMGSDMKLRWAGGNCLVKIGLVIKGYEEFD